MVRSASSPERRAAGLLTRADLSLRLNDGSTHPVRLYFDARRRGTSVIKEDDLYRDGAGARPKNFHSVTPDLLGEDFAFEIKGDVSGKEWDALSRDARNDHFRFALPRLRDHEGMGIEARNGRAHADLILTSRRRRSRRPQSTRPTRVSRAGSPPRRRSRVR
jgi:hypothetical protein